jgi:DNA repair protein RadC
MNTFKPVSENPLERVRHYGLQSVSATDLLAILLSATPEEISQKEQVALNWLHARGIRSLTTLSPAEIKELTILPDFEVYRLLAALELGRRAGNARSGPRTEIESPEDVARFFRHLTCEKKEHFCALFLNSKNGIIASRTIHIGTVNTSLVGPREIFREAIREGATSIIVAHNHPSGDPTPSPEDIAITKRLAEVGTILNIPLLDHVIIGDRGYISLNQKGHL